MAIVEALPAAPGGARRLGLRSPATLESIGAFGVATADDVSEVTSTRAPQSFTMKAVSSMPRCQLMGV